MAIYHFSGTVISRSQGRSAVACAAYRSGEALHDEYYGKTHDYTQKNDVVYSEIILPEHAPEWMRNRQTLWNTVEKTEKRKDSQLAREFNFSLPRELTLEQNIALAKEFTQQNFVNRGMVADVCIHTDKSPSGEPQPHVHVMLTMREVTIDGFGQKVREWNQKENLLLWREAWAETANRHLVLNGHDIQIDHRSYKEQGIELEPQHKIGATVARERLARLADHQRIAHENGEKILANPTIALDALTRQQSTFTHHDMARFCHRHSDEPEQFHAVFNKVKTSEQLVSLGRDEQGRERFTTREMLALETRLITQAQDLSEREGHAVSQTAQMTALSHRALTDEQCQAFEHILKPTDLTCVVGYAGTGKSYLLGAVREAAEESNYRVVGATLSGIAAENLEASSGIESRTLASHLYYWNKGEQTLSRGDILVVDEAGMLGSKQLGRVIDEVHQQGAKLVLIGDPEQLQAIEAGAAFRAISERVGYVELTDIRRQEVEWQKTATRELATAQTEKALLRYKEHHHLHEAATLVEAKQTVITLWNDARLQNPEKSHLMLAYTRQDVADLNASARQLRHNHKELGKDHRLMTASGEKAFAVHDRIYFLENNRDMGVKNGTLGTIEAIQGNYVSVRLDSPEKDRLGRRVEVNLDTYNKLDHGYAATIHKAQGVSIDRTYPLASQYMDRHSSYVALTRHRDSTDIVWSRDTFASERELINTLSRERSKDMSVDYHVFAEARGFESRLLETPIVRENTASQRMLTQSPSVVAEQGKAVAQQFSRFEKLLESPIMHNTNQKLFDDYAAKISKQPETMEYLRENNRELADKIDFMTRDQGRGRERDVGGRER